MCKGDIMLECYALWSKECRATYQRAMTTIFHDMMHKFMEDYVDDILEKSHSREEHLPILEKFFDRLE